MVEIENLTKIYKNTRVLDEITCSFSAGEVSGLEGPNGSGKTMLIRAIAGLIRPTSGFVKVEGHIIGRDRPFPDSIGVLIEGPAFLERKTAYQNLRLLSMVRRVASKEQIYSWLEAVELDPNSRMPYRKFSLGMKQRLGIAAAMFEEPRLLLLDEPTNALDASGVKILQTLIHKAAEKGACVIIASHDAAFLRSVADHVWVMSAGRAVRCVERGDNQ